MVGDELRTFINLLRDCEVEEYQDARVRIKLAPKVPAPVYYQMPQEPEDKKITDEEILMDPYAGLNL